MLSRSACLVSARAVARRRRPFRCLSSVVMTTPVLSSEAAHMKTASPPPLSAADVQLGSSQRQFMRTHSPLELRRMLSEDEEIRNDLAYCLSFSADDKDFSRNLLQLFADARMKEQPETSKNQFRNRQPAAVSNKAKKEHPTDEAPLPRTLEDALRPSHRAIVVTECKAPFRVVDVNHAWENLCGYTHVESKGKTLGSLLSGPETNSQAATALIAKVLQGEEAGATLTNYTKSGRRFRNRVRVGPLYDNTNDSDGRGSIQFFVGILQEVEDGV